MATQTEKTAPTYLMGRSEAETRRLMAQARLYGPFTRRLLEDAGMEAGMSVLDVGTGAGDVALMAAELVGPTGSVVGVEQNPEVLKTASVRAEAAGFTNVRFVAGDFREATLPYDTFDAVVGRLVLLYVPDPPGALRGLAERLKPGAIVAFGEFNFTPHSVLPHPSTPLWERTWGWMQAVVRGAGLDPVTGYNLRSTFLDAGLPKPEMYLCSPVGRTSLARLRLRRRVPEEHAAPYRQARHSNRRGGRNSHPGGEAARRDRCLERRRQGPRPRGRARKASLGTR